MSDYKSIWNVNIRKSGASLLLIVLLIFLLSVSFVASAPSAPTITYYSNTTYVSSSVNRSADLPGTISTVRLTSVQQDMKWKAYVGNVSGTLALSAANGSSIYNWASSTVTGEVYISRFANINWPTINCANAGAWGAEHTALGIVGTTADSINNTFNATTHAAITVGTNPARSNCPSTALNIGSGPQVMSNTASFQEILLRDTSGAGTNMIYAGLINASTVGYNGLTYDFQMIVAENESITTAPATTYFFWVELG